MKRRTVAVLVIALIVVCIAAMLGACDSFVFGITVAPLPENVKQLILTSGGKAPVNWNGEKLLFDSGAVVDGTLVLEPGYEPGGLKVFVYGKQLTLEKDFAGNYTFSFTMQRDGDLTFEGEPALAPRAVHITGVGADGVFVEANGKSYPLSDGNVSLELETSATEPFTLRVYSTDYLSMPSCDAIASPASAAPEPFYADGKGGAVCTFPAGINALYITLALDKAKGAPRVDLVGNPGDMFYTAAVDGAPLEEGKFALSAFEDGGAQLSLTLTDEGQDVWDAMSAAGTPLGRQNGLHRAAQTGIRILFGRGSRPLPLRGDDGDPRDRGEAKRLRSRLVGRRSSHNLARSVRRRCVRLRRAAVADLRRRRRRLLHAGRLRPL